MGRYICKRLLLLPLTLFAIVFATFIIINLAPGEPVYMMQRGESGGASREAKAGFQSPEDRYTQFRNFFGLNLPIVFNDWSTTTKKGLMHRLEYIQQKELSAKEYSKMRIELVDRARFCLDTFFSIAKDPQVSFETRRLALWFFIRGATRFSNSGPNLTIDEEKENQEIAKDNLFLGQFRSYIPKNKEELQDELLLIGAWYEKTQDAFKKPQEGFAYWKIAILDTRFSAYLKRVATLDFGVLRHDPNTTVISEVTRRLKYSLTLSVLPLIATFFFCQLFGLFMAINAQSILDRFLDLLFLILWATPVFVVGPFLIEKIALNQEYPFTNAAFPIRGFSSPESMYQNFTSWERFLDIARHITLPLLTVFYGSMAVQTRLSRAVFLDCMQQEYVQTARAKGVHPFSVYTQHIGRNAAIPIVTAIAGSLSVILGGSVIIETIFDIHGFGKFFYEAIINRDYNVMMFSTLVGSFLGLVGYVLADISYMVLDPRVRLADNV